MSTNRLEAFSDGVIAIIITIMVLELKAPAQTDLASLVAMTPVFLSYLASFIYVGIYWNNHHHLFQATEHVTGKILWANLHLLFWLSLTPFTISWIGAHYEAPLPVMAYGAVLSCSAPAYQLLQKIIIQSHNGEFVLKKAVGQDKKGKLSLALYLVSIASSFPSTPVSIGCYVAVAVIWFIPDQRIERTL